MASEGFVVSRAFKPTSEKPHKKSAKAESTPALLEAEDGLGMAWVVEDSQDHRHQLLGPLLRRALLHLGAFQALPVLVNELHVVPRLLSNP